MNGTETIIALLMCIGAVYFLGRMDKIVRGVNKKKDE